MSGTTTVIHSIFLILLGTLFITTLTATNSSALFISEVESNPSGADKGNEWVELYSDSLESLTGFYLKNNDGKIYNLSGDISGYYVISFSSQWLDNSNESVFLYSYNNLIDSTPMLEDSKNDDFSFSLCGSDWVFQKSSKGSSNACDFPSSSKEESGDEEKEESNQEDKQETNNKEESEPKDTNDEQIPALSKDLSSSSLQYDNSPIILSPPQKSEKPLNQYEDKTRIWVFIAFSILEAVIIILLALNKF